MKKKSSNFEAKNYWKFGFFPFSGQKKLEKVEESGFFKAIFESENWFLRIFYFRFQIFVEIF